MNNWDTIKDLTKEDALEILTAGEIDLFTTITHEARKHSFNGYTLPLNLLQFCFAYPYHMKGQIAKSYNGQFGKNEDIVDQLKPF